MPDRPLADRLVLVHGFTQTGASWSEMVSLLRQRLAPAPEIITPDAPGHGTNSHLELNLAEGADLLGELGGPAVYVGYSMGGRLCLHLALQRPDLVQGLVLIGATPGIEDDRERLERRAADEKLAEDIVSDGLEAFLERWVRQPLFASLPADRVGLEDRLTNSPAGLAASLRLAGTGTQTPLWNRLGELEMPVLLIAGAEDHKFGAVAERMRQALRTAQFVSVAHAGHAVHLERTETTAEVIATWLRTPQPDNANPAARHSP
jgi:2-succinyl-6-hydroxy-2,4-cyclohexadiene-1-carboxylate synthase